MSDLQIQALKFFQLTPSSDESVWMVAADWLEDQGECPYQLEMFKRKFNVNFENDINSRGDGRTLRTFLEELPWSGGPNYTESCCGIGCGQGQITIDHQKMGACVITGTKPTMWS